MLTNNSVQLNQSIPYALPPVQPLLKRVLAMTILWMGFGVFVGSTMMPGNLIGIVSGAISGAIVLPWLGMFLGLIGGPTKDSFFGGVSGLLVALLYSTWRMGSIDHFTLNLCLIIGGIIGANFATFLAIGKRLRIAQ